MQFEAFKQLPLLGILRGIPQWSIEPITAVSKESGLKAIEITMNTENASSLITEMRKHAGSGLSVGAGTVTSLNLLKQALDAGAEFIVMPNTNKSIMEYCEVAGIPVFPGALTPNEIFDAWALGATMVKVFPASVFGPSYFKEIKAPFNDIELLACGGVSTQTIAEFFKNGASAAAFGASIFKKEWIEQKNFDAIAQEISALILAYKNRQ